MTPFEMIAATWRNRKTRILAPALAVALLPVILCFIVFHMAVCIGYGVLAASLSLAWNVGEFNRDRRFLGLTFGQAFADRLRLWRADLAAYFHSSWVAVREYIGKRWRRAAYWTVFAPIALFIAILPAVWFAVMDGLSGWHRSFLGVLDRSTFAKFRAWSHR